MVTETEEKEISELTQSFACIKYISKNLGEGKAWKILEDTLSEKRLEWYEKNKDRLDLKGTDVEKAYQLLLIKLGIALDEIEIVEKTEKKIVFRSTNFCPVIEACKNLELDTREICKKVYEKPVQVLISMVNPKLKFKRNYKKIRPYIDYCEEIIELSE